MDLSDTYIMFVRQNQDILREKVNEEMYVEKLFDVSNYPARYVGIVDTVKEIVDTTLHCRYCKGNSCIRCVCKADSPFLVFFLLCC